MKNFNIKPQPENQNLHKSYSILLGILLSFFIAPISFSATPYCSDVFQNGLQTHGTDGSVNFGKNSRLIHPYSTRLNTPAVTIDSTSVLKTCGKQECTAAGIPVDGLYIDKRETWSTRNVSAADNQNIVIGGADLTAFGQVVLGKNAIATFAQGSSYTIDRLTLGSKSTLRLPAGDYWIGHFSAQANAKIDLIGEGPVTLFVQENFSLPLNFKINENTKDPSRISIYTFANSEYASGSKTYAFIRSQSVATLKNKARINGGLLANSISLESSSIVTFDSTALGKMSFNYFCSGYVPYVDTTPPQINYFYPTDTRDPQFTFSGTIKDPGGIKKATVRYGDTELLLTLVNDQFSVELPLAIGWNNFTVTAVDDAGNNTTQDFSVLRQSIAGFGFLFDPYEFYQTSNSFNITGTLNVPENHTIKSAVAQTAFGEIPLQLVGNQFSVVVPVVKGPNEYILVAFDQYDNKAMEIVQVESSEGVGIFDFKITPESGENPVREITGEVHSFWPMESLTARLKGEPLELIRVTDTISRFQKTVILTDSRHRFDIYVEAPNGQSVYEELDVWYDPDRINLEVALPDNFPGTTESETIVVTGFLHLPVEFIGVITGLVVTSDQIPDVEIPIDLIPSSQQNWTFAIEIPLAVGDNNLLFKTKQGDEDFPGGLGWSQTEVLVVRLAIE
ncbi:MAG: hypothetical protein V4660_10220 [Pseudomonadota bacterium]